MSLRPQWKANFQITGYGETRAVTEKQANKVEDVRFWVMVQKTWVQKSDLVTMLGSAELCKVDPQLPSRLRNAEAEACWSD